MAQSGPDLPPVARLADVLGAPPAGGVNLVTLEKWPEDWNERRPSEDDPSLVGQHNWCFLIPRLHAALANPRADVTFPRLAHTDDNEPVHAFWETALYMLHFLLGWADPGRGLEWWYRGGRKGLGDPCLSVLRRIWVADEDFDLFAAWCWERGTTHGVRGSYAVGIEDLVAIRVNERPRPPAGFFDAAWWKGVQRRKASRSEPYVPNPYFGGTNSLHLGHSRDACDKDSMPGLLLHSESRERRAVLVLEQARGWYRQLLLHGQALPSVGQRSWHVDVLVKPVGWLGTFRRSRVSGLWFRGKHSIHMAGQPA
jgi:hypothetical protein